MKRIYSLILIIAIICMNIPVVVMAEGTDTVSAFSEIPVTLVAEVNKLSKGAKLGDSTGGSWARFDNVDFGNSGIGRFQIKVGVSDQHAGQRLTFHLDSLTNLPFAEMNVASTGGFSNQIWQEATVYDMDITGIHSIFICYYGDGTGDVSAIKMTASAENDFANVPSDVLGTGLEEEFEILHALGIVEWDGSAEFGVMLEVTAKEFTDTALRLKDGTAEESQQLLQNCGLEADEIITNEKASEVITVLLNRRNVKKAEESFYHMITALTDIRPGGAATDKVTRLSMIKLLYEVSDAEIMEARGIEYDEGGAYVEYAAREDNNLLSYYRNIRTEEGIVTMDYHTGLDSMSDLREDQILIDDYLFTLGDCSAADLLGSEVKFYYIQSRDENKLLYLKKTEDANNLVINAKDIVSYKNRVITYETETGSTKREEVPKNAKIIYNGLAAPVYSDSMFDMDTGSVEFVYSDGDELECIKVTNAKNYQVAKFSDNVIYLKGTDLTIDLEGSGIEYDLVDKYGNPSKTMLLTSDVVCTISEAVDINNSYTYYCIRLSRRIINDTVETVNVGERTIGIDGVVYECAPTVTDEMLNSVSAGSGIKAYLNVYNEIAFIGSGQSTQAAGYIANAYYNEDDEKVWFRIFDETGTMQLVSSADYVIINDVRYADTDVLGIVRPNDIVRNELVIFNINAAGKLTKLNFAEDNGKGSDETGLYKYLSGRYRYKSGSNSLGGKTLLSSQFKVFNIPEDKANYEDYSVAYGRFIDDENLNMTFYNREQNKLEVTIGVREVNAAELADVPEYTDIYYFTGRTMALNSDEEVAYKIEYYNGQGKTKQSRIVDEDFADVAETLKVGDGIRFTTDADGEITGLKRVFSIQDNAIYSGNSGFNAQTQIVKGDVYRFENGAIQMNENGEVLNCNSAAVYMYDSEENELELSSISEVLDYSSVGGAAHYAFVYAYYTKVRSVVLVK